MYHGIEARTYTHWEIPNSEPVNGPGTTQYVDSWSLICNVCLFGNYVISHWVCVLAVVSPDTGEPELNARPLVGTYVCLIWARPGAKILQI